MNHRDLISPRMLIPLFGLIGSISYAQSFLCVPSEFRTEVTFGVGIFNLIIEPECLRFNSLTDKTKSWTWRISVKNSLGDAEGSRNFCDGVDAGLVGNPAVWRMPTKQFIVFQTGGVAGPGALFFNCTEAR